MKAYSERVSGKNMRLFCGRPLFHWIVNSLFESGVVDEIIINTDSKEIAHSAESNFNVTIHMRPQYLLDIQENEANQIINYDLEHTTGNYFIQTHSTNPLLNGSTIKKAVNTYFDNLENFDSLFSVTPLQSRFYYGDGNPVNHDPKKLIKTQNLNYLYEENSCIYVFSKNSFLNNQNRIGKKPLLFHIDKSEAVDIDEEYDFTYAESLMENL